MRLACLALLAFLLPSGNLRADDAADARAIVARGVKAAGIPTGKPIALTYKVQGQNVGGGFDNAFSGTVAFQAPDKFRMTVQSGVTGRVQMPRRGLIRRRIANEINGMINSITIDAAVVANGNKVWQSVMGSAQELAGKQREKFIASAYQQHVATLAPLLADKEFKLSTAGQKIVNGRKAAAVKVERNQKQTITLCFDEETGLLAKYETTANDESQGWKEVVREVYLEDYKEIGGSKHYTKMRLVEDGKPLVVDAITEPTFVEKLDPKLFEALQ